MSKGGQRAYFSRMAGMQTTDLSCPPFCRRTSSTYPVISNTVGTHITTDGHFGKANQKEKNTTAIEVKR